eukprot:1612488-Ditylum_brightwellii.AAC.1
MQKMAKPFPDVIPYVKEVDFCCTVLDHLTGINQYDVIIDHGMRNCSGEDNSSHNRGGGKGIIASIGLVTPYWYGLEQINKYVFCWYDMMKYLRTP